MSRPQPLSLGRWLIYVVILSTILGALFCWNKALGVRGIRDLAYWQLLALPYLGWVILCILAVVLPGKRRRK